VVADHPGQAAGRGQKAVVGNEVRDTVVQPVTSAP
jgi:hypothetical protein